MASRFAVLLEGMVARPGARVRELPWMGEAERRRVVEEWNATDVTYAAWGSLPERLGAQARATPDAGALTYEGETWSYAEFDARVTQLAHRLKKLGVGPEVRVGVCMERSLELVTSV